MIRSYILNKSICYSCHPAVDSTYVLNNIQSDQLKKWPSLRFSFSVFNTRAEVDYVISSLKEFVN